MLSSGDFGLEAGLRASVNKAIVVISMAADPMYPRKLSENAAIKNLEHFILLQVKNVVLFSKVKNMNNLVYKFYKILDKCHSNFTKLSIMGN